jgi:hypothetical protein
MLLLNLLKVESTDLVDGLSEGTEEAKVTAFGSSNWVNDGVLHRDKKQF